ncbi:MAG: hypothetical protein A4E52_00599 [Pelotomaculum sp. PtaB.Bin013]|uniref:DUF169 domain-containing protein n=1 Tax=Pelotomaculum isophthalicicum JI TaxID=947010 RepID=A0A9X4H7R2_9FIRM|nr:DUF169 domain-containing protein [Pelotomaculum isophthalicicum]MDF9409944.1 DUF169 domain-containing protein [Pelotomaculum isophthalicicum JI]OPX91114.1 MAG: hypothetical protein A4E52_00599 [Pelotomaculum sp. PtaB.Bin013]
MESRLAKELHLATKPVAILLTNEKPEGALQFQPGRWGCVMAMLKAASRGKTAVFNRETVGCGGGGVGLGFGNAFHASGAGDTGGIEYFLSTGRGEGYPEGEGYRKTPELAACFVGNLPIIDLPYTYRVFKPLDQVDPAVEEPCLVTFYVNADQLCGLVVMANYDRPDLNNVTIPHCSGCQGIFIIPYNEAQSENPRAVVGMMDPSARPFIDPGQVTFTVPYKRFLEMEANIPGSFLTRSTWNKLAERLAGIPSEVPAGTDVI